MCDTSAPLSYRYQPWNHLTTQRKSKLGPYNDTIGNSNAKSNLKYNIWNILKNNPNGDFKDVREDFDTKTSRRFVPQRLICYSTKTSNSCECAKIQGSRSSVKTPSRDSRDSQDQRETCCVKNPLNKTLRDVNKALSFKKTCKDKIHELNETKNILRQQIDEMEKKGPETIKRIKEAEVMWCDMAENYKNKEQKALEKLDITQKERIETETSVRQWRRNKNNLEYEISSTNKYEKELTEILKAKKDKIDSTRNEINELKQKINATKNQIKVVNECMKNKKTASNVRIKSLSTEMNNIKKLVHEEHNHKRQKQLEGSKSAKETRKDLHKIYRLSLQKKLENDLLRTQIETTQNDIDVIKTKIGCLKNKFEINDKDLSEEIAKVDSELANFKVQCAPCHKSVDTSDVRNICTDCPRCVEGRICLHDGSHCFPDVTKECICTSTKEKFINNVFKNMNTVLENQIDTPAGKKVADAVLKYVKKSRNGKLNEETRKILQDFVLSGLKRNLNSTIIGGAIKTRCEMNTDAYNRLMLCLKDIEVPLSLVKDKNTAPIKGSCLQWNNETSECNCPKGPNSCACTQISHSCDPKICRETATEMTTCPNKKISCGTMCGRAEIMSYCNPIMDAKPRRQTSYNDKLSLSYLGSTVVSQCISGEKSLSLFATKAHKMNVPFDPEVSVPYHQEVSNYESTLKKKGEARKGLRYHKAYTDKKTNINVRCALVVK